MRSVLLLGLVLTACGDDGKQQAPASDAGQTTSAPVQATESTDLAVTVVRELGYCDMQANGKTVYVLATKTFKTCDGTTGSWYDIDVKGDKGETGKQGDKGDVGTKGDEGEEGMAGAPGQAGPKGDDGEQGDQGVAGQDGQTVTGALWYDPIADQYWTITTVATSYAGAQAACTGDWQLPSLSQWTVANSRGLAKAINSAGVEAWLNDGTHARFDGTTNVSDASPFCVEST